MTNKDWDNIIFACDHFNNIAMNISMYTEVLSFYPALQFLTILTNRDAIKLGNYATLLGSNIFISDTVKNKCLRIKNNNDWSDNIPLEVFTDNFDKLIKLKIFW